MIDGKNFFDQAINSELKTYENIRKIAVGKGDDYTADCLLDYSYFKESYKIFAVDLSKPQALDADPRAIQQINFTVNLDRAGNTTMFFIIKKSKRNCVRLFKRNCKSFFECNSIECNFVEYSFIKCNFNEWFIFYEYKMTEYNSLNIKLSNSRFNKLKSAIKSKTEVVLRLLSSMVGDDE